MPYAVSGLKYEGVLVDGPTVVANIKLNGTGSVNYSLNQLVHHFQSLML